MTHIWRLKPGHYNHGVSLLAFSSDQPEDRLCVFMQSAALKRSYRVITRLLSHVMASETHKYLFLIHVCVIGRFQSTA